MLTNLTANVFYVALILVILGASVGQGLSGIGAWAAMCLAYFFASSLWTIFGEEDDESSSTLLDHARNSKFLVL